MKTGKFYSSAQIYGVWKKKNPDIDISIQGVCDVCIIGYLQNNDH